MNLSERGAALADLDAGWRQAAAGRGRVVLVSGEAGIGKSSLVRTFLDHGAAPSAARRWVGLCDPWATPPPLGPWLDMAEDDPDLAATLAETLTTADPKVLAPRLLRMLRRPTVVVVEDAHWMDDATGDVLTYLARRIERTRTLLVVTHRDEPDDLGEPARRFLAATASSLATRIALAPLSREAVAELADGSGADVDDLLRRTRGNPLYVTELLATGGDGVPPSIGSAVASRVARLPSDVRDVVDLASLAPEGLEVDLAEAVLGRALGSAVDTAAAAGVLGLTGRALHFRHELVRLAAADAVPAGRRLALQRALVAALEDLTDPDAARLVHHVRQVGDGDRLRRWGPAAAAAALQRGANAAAVEHLEATLAVGEALTAEERAEHLDALTVALQDFSALVTATATAAEAWRRLGDPVRQARALARQAVARHNVLDLDAGRESIELAWSLVRDRPLDRDTAAILASHLYWRAMCDHLDHRHPLLEVSDLDAAVAGTGAVGAEEARALTLMVRGRIHAREGNLEASVGDGEEAITSARAHDPNRAVVWATNVAEALVEVGAVEEARRFAERGVELGRERDVPGRLAFAHLTRARVHIRAGDLSAASADLALAQEHSDGHDIVRVLGAALRAVVAVRRGDFEAATLVIEASAFAHVTELTYAWPIATATTEYAWLCGDLDAVDAATAVTLEIGRAARHPWAVGEMLWWRATAGLDDGPAPPWAAAPWLLMLDGRWDEAAAAWDGAPYERALALAHGDTDERMAALAIADRLGAAPLGDVLRERLRRSGLRSVPTRPHSIGGELTDRQREILVLMAEGLSNPEIARRLHIARKTTAHHVSAVLARLGASSRTEAVTRAVREGLLD